MSSNIQIERKCECCGKPFTARTFVTRYCSKKCNSKHYKQLVNQQKVEIHINQTNTLAAESMDHVNTEYLAVDEAATLMRVSRRTLFRLIEQNKLRKKKIRSRTVILKKDIQTFFEYQ